MDVNHEVATSLGGQTVIVTGGTRGIGLGIVRVLARAGCNLMVTGRKPERLETVAAELSKAGVPHRTMQANVGERESSAAVVAATVEAFGTVDGLVANAQSFRPVTDLEQVTESDFDLVLETGPKGTLFLMQAVLPVMREAGRGRIVTFGSSMGNTGAHAFWSSSSNKSITLRMIINSMAVKSRFSMRSWGLVAPPNQLLRKA